MSYLNILNMETLCSRINLENPSEIDKEVLLTTSAIQSAITECSYSANQSQVTKTLSTNI